MTEEAHEEIKDEAKGDFVRELRETLDSLTGDVDQSKKVFQTRHLSSVLTVIAMTGRRS